MNNQIINDLRQQLHNRVKKFDELAKEQTDLFSIYLDRFWSFFDNEPIFVGIMNELMAKYPGVNMVPEQIFCIKYHGKIDLREAFKFEKGSAAIGYALLRELSRQNNIYHKNRGHGEDPIRTCYLRLVELSHPHAEIETIKTLLLIPMCEYIEEQLDARRIFLSLLIRYKHRSEWFNHERLYQLFESNTKKTEKMFALDLYSYLYDRGIDFSIEPSSISGEIDIIAAQGTEDPLLADVKVFDGDRRGKSYIRKAFNQIYTYTQQFNEVFGYLIIFKITDRDLCFSLSNQHIGTPFITYNHKTIFLITIDVFTYSKPVSQRNLIEPVTITEEYLIQFIQEQNNLSDNIQGITSPSS